MVVHEKSKNAFFDIIKAVFSDYESGGYRFPRSGPYREDLVGCTIKKFHVLIMNRGFFLFL